MTELPGCDTSVVKTVRVTLVRAAVVVALTGAGALSGVVQPAGAGAAAPAVTATAPAAAARPAAAPARQQPEPVNVVQAYLNALNNDEFEAAWALGGKNISGSSYDAFVEATQGTDQDVVSIDSVVGNKVTVTFEATQTDGSHGRFTGTYTVQDGVIVAADVHRV